MPNICCTWDSHETNKLLLLFSCLAFSEKTIPTLLPLQTEHSCSRLLVYLLQGPEEWTHHAGKRSKKVPLPRPDTVASDAQDQSQDKAHRQTCKEAAEETVKRISAIVTDVGHLASQLPDDLTTAHELYRTARAQSKNAELSKVLRQVLQKAALKLATAIHP